MADAGLVDAALMEVLANDAPLRTLCPDGVYWGLAPADASAFVIVALLDHAATPALAAETLYERAVYLVKAVILSASATPARAAASRIQVLLHQADLDLTPSGYGAMVCQLLERVRLPPELDPLNTGARWQHAGGQYEVWTHPLTVTEGRHHATTRQ